MLFPRQPEILKTIRHLALDLDGTVYKDGRLFDGVLECLEQLRHRGIGYTFLTNNSSRSTTDYLDHLRDMGIPARPGEVYTSADATIQFLHHTMPDLKRLFLLGTGSLAEQFRQAGFELTDEEPEAVVVAFDQEMTYARLCETAYWVSQGKPYLATHPDRICPTDQPTVLVDCGAICQAIEASTGRKPDAVLGKPDPRMLEGILRQNGLTAQELAMVGDRLYTDMAMAHQAGAVGVLVLTGEATAEEAAALEKRPDWIVDDLVTLGQALLKLHPKAT